MHPPPAPSPPAASPAPPTRRGMQLYTKILLGMIVGVVLGLLVGPNAPLLPQDGLRVPPRALVVAAPGDTEEIPQAAHARDMVLLDATDDGAWLHVAWQLEPRDVVRLEQDGVAARVDQALEGYIAADTPGLQRYATLGQRLVDATAWIGALFLALIKMVVVPLVFFSLIVGVASLGDFRKLGKIGGATLGYFTLTTIVALVIGLGLTNLVAPGALVGPDDRLALMSSYQDAAGEKVVSAVEAPSLGEQLVGIIPSNPFAALARGDMLAIIFFAAMLGVAFTLMEAARARRAVNLFASLNEAMIVLVHVAMKLAPYGVAALLFDVVGSTGLSVLGALAAYAGVVLTGLALHVLITYGAVIKALARLPFIGFIGALRSALALAFSTSSSAATLPVTKECCESNLQVSEEITSFVLPIGATVNMDGTALYQGVAAVFIAQIYGIDLTLGDQLTIVVSATLASVGAAGVPGAGMITLAMVLTTIGVPTAGLALVLGVDRLLDMFRTTTNVIGDATAAVLMARMQGETLRVVPPDEDAADPTRGMEGRLDHPAPQPVAPDDP